jgi:MoxR-like ATPase
MNVRNYKKFVKHVYKKCLKGVYLPLMAVGATGVGKTQVTEQIGAEIGEEFGLKDFQVINYRLSQKEQGDLVGLPIEIELVPCPYCIENGEDEFHQTIMLEKQKVLEHIHNVHERYFKENKKPLPSYMEVMDLIRAKYSHLIQIKTANATPDQFPTSGHGILHLDELNRATKGTRDAVFELILERRLGKYVLPPGWIIVSSINPPTEEYVVYDIDGAMIARFCWILFCPEVDEWLNYAQDTGVSKTTLQFIREYPAFLGNDLVDYPYERIHCPRMIKLMDDILEGLPEDLIYEVAAGCIGSEAATSYMALQQDKKRPVSADKILNDYEKVQNKIKEYSSTKNNRADLLRASIDEMLHLLSKREDALADEQIENLCEFFKDIPKDLTVGLLKLMSKSEEPNIRTHFTKLSNDEGIRKMIQDNFSSISRGAI